MAQSIPPVRLDSLGGVFTGGNVFRRPGDTAVRCHNLRPMPGGALRLRGGWQRRSTGTPSNIFQQFHEFRKGTFSGGIFHIAQRSDSSHDTWYQLLLGSYVVLPLEDVGGGPANMPRAITTVRDKVFWDNGLGIRDATNSRPALSSWDGTTVRYVGLDAWIPTTPPIPPFPFTGSTGLNYNTFIYGVDIWIGLYNEKTNHYSNGIYCGTLGPMSGQTIVIEHQERVTWVAHDPTEEAELFYVFYATGDGLKVPFLILNADGSDVFKTSVTAPGNIFLSITTSVPEGFLLSPAHEMPTENFPPRPMADICYQNGRVYYIPAAGGSGPPTKYQGFSYVVDEKEAPSVGWSASADDSVETEFVGVPEESFPLTNRKFVPSGERPLKIADLGNRGQVLVLTGTMSFWLEETMDGLHIFQRISENRGILDKRTYVRTPRGPMWVTQHKEIVLLHEDSMSLEVLSPNYSEMMASHPGILGLAADYLLDPAQMIDRYQVWASNGWFAIHDFRLEQDQEMRDATASPAYTGQAFTVTAARTMRSSSGKTYHLVALDTLWTQESQPDVEHVPVIDQAADGTLVEITGEWISQWLDFGDPLLRKEISEVFLIGDSMYSAQINDRPLTLYWYSDLYTAAPGSTDNITSLMKHDQSPSDLSLIGKLNDPHMRWLKLRAVLRGHSQDLALPYYPRAVTDTGELNVKDQIYGTLAQLAITQNGAGGNR